MILYLWRRPSVNPVPISPAEGFTHASHPTVVQVENNRFLLVFSSRDRSRHSHLFGLFISVDSGLIKLEGEIKLLVSPGEPGAFDCDGILPCNFVRDGNSVFLYYCGWQNLPEGRWICDSGRFIVDVRELTCRREFDGPRL